MTSMQKLRILILYPNPEGLALLASMLRSPGSIIEEAVNDLIDLFFIQVMALAQRKSHILAHGKRVKKGAVLEDHGHFFANVL